MDHHDHNSLRYLRIRRVRLAALILLGSLLLAVFFPNDRSIFSIVAVLTGWIGIIAFIDPAASIFWAAESRLVRRKRSSPPIYGTPFAAWITRHPWQFLSIGIFNAFAILPLVNRGLESGAKYIFAWAVIHLVIIGAFTLLNGLRTWAGGAVESQREGRS